MILKQLAVQSCRGAGFKVTLSSQKLQSTSLSEFVLFADSEMLERKNKNAVLEKPHHLQCFLWAKSTQ